jgi:hypothetical protein
MKYLSLLVLGSSLVAGASFPRPNLANGLRGNQASGNSNSNANSNANSNSNGRTGNSNGNANTNGNANSNSNSNRNSSTNANSNNNNGNTNSNNNGMTGNNTANGNNNGGTTTSSAPGNAVSAANVAPGANPFLAVGGNNKNQFPSLTDNQKTGLQNAANLWAQDTAVVSSALSTLGSGGMSDQDFRDTADMAYMAEVNELQQKNYIDALLGTMPQLMAASTSLSNGSFAIVVDQLREMRIRGQSNQTFVQAAVQGMNNLRCRQVLLAIDAYVQTANQAAGNNSFISATRPPACQQVYAQTADTLPAGSVTNATTFPNANQLITQFNQPPRFMISNAVAFSQNSGSDSTPALGSQFTANAPFSNTSSLSGQLLAFQGQPLMTNGAATNTKANPLNAVLFSNNGNANNNGNNNGNANANNGNANTNNGNANTNNGNANANNGNANTNNGNANANNGNTNNNN